MAEVNEIEQVVRTRLRSLRNTLGLSLDELAARANRSASTISRVETGKRTISLDVLLPLARALQVDIDAQLDVGVSSPQHRTEAPNDASALSVPRPERLSFAVTTPRKFSDRGHHPGPGILGSPTRAHRVSANH